MNNLDIWEEIEGLGKLSIERELVVGYEPVLFVCVDEHNKRYLVMTYDPYDCIYEIIKISTNTLLEMLTNQKAMEQIFREAIWIYETQYDEERDILVCKLYNSRVFPADRLPVKDEFFELNSKKISQYIDLLTIENRIADIRVEYQNYGIKFQTVDFSINLETNYVETGWNSSNIKDKKFTCIINDDLGVKSDGDLWFNENDFDINWHESMINW